MSELKQDFLDVDPPIAGQNYVCLSFVSPEKILKEKQFFLFHRFLKDITKDYQLESEDQLEDKYKNWLYSRQTDLDNEFYKKNNFRTTVRGLKVRGVHENYELAKMKARKLQLQDPAHHVFVGQVGYWLPWDPVADNVQEEEFANEQLNELIHKYKENQVHKDMLYHQLKQEQMQDAIKKVAEKKQEKQPTETEDTTTLFEQTDAWTQKQEEDGIDNLINEIKNS